VGITRAVSGTITEPSSIAKNRLRPRNRYLANPYPASTARTVAPTPPVKAYRNELPSQRQYRPPFWVKSCFAIDPGIVEDADGTPWMAFGSFWGGIQMIRLEWPSGMPADPSVAPVHLASHTVPPNAIEAPTIVRHDGWFYLFVSRDLCCRASASTYNMVVGRSREVTGPYVDRSGADMAADGGERLLATRGDMVGPGGESYSNGYLAFHYYATHLGGDFQLAIRKVAWDADGWPVLTTADEQRADAG